MNANLLKLARGVVASVILLTLVWLVSDWWGEYKDATPTRAASETTATADASGSVSPAEEKGSEVAPEPSAADKAAGTPKADAVVILIDGLNFRVTPEGDAKSIRGLEKGEKLTLLGSKDGWYEVRDDKGEEGWVSSNENYTRIERR